MSRAQSTPKNGEPSQEPAEVSQLGLFTPRTLVELLFPKAASQLNGADLLAIVAGGADFAEAAAGNAAAAAEGIGCLVAHDGATTAGSGNFQAGDDVGRLLWHMQAQFQTIEGVAAAVAWAASELQARGRK